MGITPLGSIYLWVVWVSPLTGKVDTQVSQPLMVSWVCPRTPVSFPGYTVGITPPGIMSILVDPHISLLYLVILLCILAPSILLLLWSSQ